MKKYWYYIASGYWNLRLRHLMYLSKYKPKTGSWQWSTFLTTSFSLTNWKYRSNPSLGNVATRLLMKLVRELRCRLNLSHYSIDGYLLYLVILYLLQWFTVIYVCPIMIDRSITNDDFFALNHDEMLPHYTGRDIVNSGFLCLYYTHRRHSLRQLCPKILYYVTVGLIIFPHILL